MQAGSDVRDCIERFDIKIHFFPLACLYCIENISWKMSNIVKYDISDALL